MMIDAEGQPRWDVYWVKQTKKGETKGVMKECHAGEVEGAKQIINRGKRDGDSISITVI